MRGFKLSGLSNNHCLVCFSNTDNSVFRASQFFTQGNLQSEKITTLTVEEEEEFYIKMRITELSTTNVVF